MSYETYAEQKIDVVVGGRLFNISWLITNLGICVLQMLLLAQAWQQSHLATWTACVAGCWLLGSLLTARLGVEPRSPRTTRLLGFGFSACALLWVRMLAAVAPRFSLLPLNLATILIASETLVIALLLGALSGAWLAQQRPWPRLDERVALGRGLCGTVIGLCIVWLLPAYAGAIGLLCLAPLLALDCWPQAQCPLPTPGKLLDAWYDSNGETNRRRMRLNRRDLPRGWWQRYLAQRGRLFLTLLGSSATIFLGAVWYAVPTPFAAGLAATHAAETLGWLVIGQSAALLSGLACFNMLRDVLGPPDRLIPQRWQSRARATSLGALALVAGGLLALGWPSLQAPWSLAASIALYTLAAAAWGILLPRLKPNVNTIVMAQRHMLTHHITGPLVSKSQLAYEQAQEEYVTRTLATLEGLLTLLIAPGIGWCVDRLGVDMTLRGAGLCFLACVVLACVAYGIAKIIRRGGRRARYTHWRNHVRTGANNL